MNDRWPQQSIFIERVKAFAKDNGFITPRGAVDLPIVAAMLKMSESTLRQALHYRGKHRLNFDSLVHIAGVLGCHVNDFTGAPGPPPPGIGHREWAQLPEDNRLFASEVLNDMMTDTLSPIEKSELFALHREGRERILRLRGL